MKRANIKDVAKAAGVSITTVSRALNGYTDVSEATKERIKGVVAELNYVPDANARSLGGKSNTTIALLLSGLDKTDEGGFTFGILSGIYHASINNDCDFILLTTNASKQSKMNYLQLCRQKNIDGVVILGIKTDDPYYDELMESEIPCALIDLSKSGKNIVSISIDNVDAAYVAVKNLLMDGHKKIGMINGSTVADVSRERFSGYAMALLEYSIVLNLDYIRYTNFDDQTAYENTLELLTTYPEITAVFCASDLIAMGALRAITKLGRKIPEDISVIGFDDMPTAKYIQGGLTTIKQDPFIMGQEAGNALCAMLRNEKVDSHITVPYKFMKRNTTGKAKS